ncbi:hypothetical protein [Flavobacterium lacus]|jgi:hypothetical protein|uniref:Uncharacterized protein n=1 Tax=Flavobacterium lacus TaxID=1353778 RepID=A0A328WNX0_9FLAO|nr:hypothetical protein [Flavobacterium lacus]RAR46856.1 hypothetical protein B0I10_11474 [Flavobacterium lacus]
MKKIIGLFLVFVSGLIFAQKPSGIPSDTGKVDLSETSDVVLYIVIPAVVVILYFIWKKQKKNGSE